MANREYLPSNDYQFDTKQEQIVSYVGSHIEEWNISQEFYDSLLPLQANWHTCFMAASNPMTRTPVAITAKNEARAAYQSLLRQFIMASITYNPRVPDYDRSAMGLPIHSKSRRPSPVPSTIPQARVDSTTVRRLTIHFRDSGSLSKARPAGTRGMELLWCISDVPPMDTEQLVNTSFYTRTPLTLSFKDEERGKTFYFAMRWENTRGKKGPLSLVFSAVVP